MVGPSPQNQALNLWLKEAREFNYPLAMPRWIKMGLEEFATESAVRYFTEKKELMIGPFPENLEKTDIFLIMAKEHLKILEDLMVGGPYFWGDQLSIDDFHVFASLRCLTTTKEIIFPDKIQSYMNEMSNKTGVNLHWEVAL